MLNAQTNDDQLNVGFQAQSNFCGNAAFPAIRKAAPHT
jgi:hypothetical protein